MARKPNHLSITFVCGRCRGTIYLPTSSTYYLLSIFKRVVNLAHCGKHISSNMYLDNHIAIKEFEDKYDFLYNEE